MTTTINTLGAQIDNDELPEEQRLREITNYQELITACTTADGFDMKKLAEKLGIDTKYWDGAEQYGASNNYEYVLSKVGELNKHGCYNALMDIVTDQFIQLTREGFRGWSHSLCHTFEHYKQAKKGRSHRDSLLNSKHNREYNTRLVDEAVKRAIKDRDLGSISRILHPIQELNIDNTDLDKPAGGEFYYRPESIINTELVAVYADDKSGYAFAPDIMTAATPRELFIQIVRNRLQHAGDRYFGGGSLNFPIEKLIATLEKLQPELSIPEIEKYLSLAIYNDSQTGISLNDLKNNLATAEQAHEIIPGIFIDIEGTLIDKKGELDESHIKSMQDAYDAGNAITIITGGDTKEATVRLRAMQIPETFLPVRSKSDYQGKVLEILIDDTAPNIQGLKAKQHSKDIWSLKRCLENNKVEKITETTVEQVVEVAANIVAVPEPIASKVAVETDETAEPQLRVLGTAGVLSETCQMIMEKMAPELMKNAIMLFYMGEQNQYEALHEAMEILNHEPSTKLIVCYLGDKHGPEGEASSIKKLVNSERVIFADIVSSKADFWTKIIEFLQKKAEQSPSPNDSQTVDPLLAEATMEAKNRILGMLKHDLKDYVIAENGESLRKILQRAREVFGIKPEAPDQSVIAFIQTAKLKHHEVMTGDIAGVYCDLDDTLLMKDGSLNQGTLMILEQCLAAGKEVLIWTGGDLDEAAKRIKGTSLEKFRLVSKTAYCGATAEIVIDNVSLEKFIFQYGIKAKRFIRV